jgi:hypothetical protein
MSQTETLKLENGYSGIFCQVHGPHNPLNYTDCHPPTVVRFWDRSGWSKWEDHGTGLEWGDLFELIPDEKFSLENLPETLTKLNCSDFTAEDYQKEAEEWGTTLRDAVRDVVRESDCVDDSSYRGKGMEFLETLASLAGIPFNSEQSNGNCQGDHVQVFSAILPSWIEKTGCPEDCLQSAMETVVREYSAYAWGNVWFLETVVRPDGTEAERETWQDCCGDCYGDPDETETGALEGLKEAAAADFRAVSKEEQEAAFWASRDSLTV